MNLMTKAKTFAPLLMCCFKLIRDLPQLIKSVIRNKRRFRYSHLDGLKNKMQNGFVVLGSGGTVNELSNQQIKCIGNKVSIAVGRWIYNDFVPDIYLIETGKSEDMLRWLRDFCKKLLEKELNYKNTIILIDNVSGDSELQCLIDECFPNSLKDKLFYTQSVKPPNGSRLLFSSFLTLMKVTRIHYLLGLTVHCRSSTVLSALIGYYMGARAITLVGVDGYTGYFADESNTDFHTDYGGIEKNYTQRLHSTSNPEFGVPTVTDCFICISQECIPCLVSSRNALLSQYLEVDDLSLDEFKSSLNS